ncbi:MAG: manganese efflux pump [Firmicutes bacterium]|nr:manganese efflux pump [Bacillota bacterium]
MTLLDILITTFLLIFIVSLDLAAVGFAYGTNRIRVPFLNLFVISLIGSIILGSALAAGYFLRAYISETAITWTVFTLFMMIGIFKIISWYTSRKKEFNPDRKISLQETFLLALVLSIDGIGVAFGAGLERVTLLFIVIIVLVSLITDILLFKFGHYLGSTLAKKSRRNLGWLSGVILITIAIVQIFI